ncbi:hypothetical protein CloPEP1_0017 [Clostridium phage Clo-PEP-1]|nr:hypothetical protein CloPEP1_0017 [Clostridium phage Clo-PEP-1]QGF20087.1 phospholipase DDHD2 isoform X1 [Clostridium phage CPAS-15]UYE90990.1 hypothetical protein P21_00013 [Clostridium phage P21]
MKSYVITRKNSGVSLADTDMGQVLAKILCKHGGTLTIEEIEPEHIGQTFSIVEGKRIWYNRKGGDNIGEKKCYVNSQV